MLVLDELPRRFPEPRQLALDHLPDQLEAHAQIVVDQLVAHPRYSAPPDLWGGCARLLGELLDGLSDHLEVSKHGVLDQRIREEPVSAAFRIALDSGDRVEDVQQVRTVPFGQSGTAPA